MKYRIFTNDVGPHKYSAFVPIEASIQAHAEDLARRKVQGLSYSGRPLRVLVVPERDISKLRDGDLEKMSRERFPG